ncbi:hypothetical protein [Nocardia veterana]|uniref:Uncharacterized protein n=1 Tax=Nocardia veterana TaxID=132249 RepID=A0A7X6M215_9NOCA|nr:hypothetical protein [Nocardia veterana]NKY87927.1 hypothetical protein [Nocardia veterana]
MRATADPAMRLRGSCVGAASATVSVAAHALGGGAPAPGSAGIMLLLATSTVIGSLAAHARTGALRLMALLAVGQVAGHAALSLAPHCHDMLLTAPMLIAHVVAIVVGAGLIRAAESTLLRAISRIRRAVAAVHALLVSGDPVVIVTPDTPGRPHRLVLASGTGRRGPPAYAGSYAVRCSV